MDVEPLQGPEFSLLHPTLTLPPRHFLKLSGTLVQAGIKFGLIVLS